MTLKVNQISNAILDVFPFVFSNDNGKAYVGGREFVVKKNGVIPVKKGQRVVVGCQPITYGLYPGSGDKIGWTEKRVCDLWHETIGGMLACSMKDKQGCEGCKGNGLVAIFTSIEIKTAKDILSKKQRTWNRVVRLAGGIVEVWKDVKGEIVRMKEAEIE